MTGFLAEWLAAIGFVLAESGPYLLVGFVIAGLLKVLIPERWIAARMGGDDLRSVVTASLLGVPIPLCSCSVIPTATQLRRSGASKGATTSFLISTPETGVDSIGVTWALMDPLMTIVRPIAAFVTAVVSGALVNGLEARDARPSPDEELPAAAGGESCCHAEPAPDAEASEHDHDQGADDDAGSGGVVRRALRYAFGPLLDDLAPWFVLGFIVSGLIVVLVPDDFFAGSLASGWLAMLVMLFAGVPLYICASASTPVAAALMVKGLSPGAALVLLLAGPATNIATILVVRDLLGKRVLWAYLGSIAVCSLALGALVNGLYPFLGLDPTDMDIGGDTMQHGLLGILTGLALAVLMLRSVRRQRSVARLGAWLRRVLAPVGLDLTSWPVRAALGLVLVGSYARTAVSVVGPGETGFLVRFGRVVDTLEEPGVRVHAPWPITRLETVATNRIEGRDYGFDRDRTATQDLGALDLVRARQVRERLEAEAEVLTRDEYLLSVAYSIHYRVTDARRWRFGHEAPDALVGALAEGALRAAAARMDSLDLLTGARLTLRADVEARLQRRLDELALGAEVVGVRLRDIHAPAGVHTAFRDVASAAEDRQALRHRASQVASTIRADAAIEAVTKVRGAEADATLRRALALGSSEGLTRLGEVARTSPEAAAWILWLEGLERALTGHTVLMPLSPGIRIITLDGDGEAAPPSAADLFRDAPR